MPLFFERNDIVRIHTEAICFGTDPMPKVGSGVDKAVYKAAGKYKLMTERKRFGELRTGESISTAAYGLNAKTLIHTVVPNFIDGNHGEYDVLQMCYTSALQRACEMKCESIAFPLLGAGNSGFPMEQAFHMAVSAISSFLMENDITVYIVVYDKSSFRMSTKISSAVDTYIDDNYVTENSSATELTFSQFDADNISEDKGITSAFDNSLFGQKIDYERLTEEMGSSFHTMLFDFIDRSGLSDVEVYKAANMDKKLFSKIRSTSSYTPRKGNCLALAIALQLSLEDTEKLLNAAEFTLSRSSKRDLALIWHIQNRIYDIHTINIHLSMKDLPLLGSSGKD